MVVYNIFIYERGTGLLFWKKTFVDKIDDNKVELFSSFFSAIQSFVKDLVSESSTEGLKNIEMGDYIINNNAVPELGVDIVIIADKDDGGELDKIAPRIGQVLQNHSELLENWDGKVQRLRVLDAEIIDVLLNDSTLLTEDLISERERKALEQRKDKNYINEYNFLQNRFNKVKNLPKKLTILEQMEMIAEKIDDQEKLKVIEKRKKKVKSDIKKTKQKITYYLSRAKECISANFNKQHTSNGSIFDLSYRDAYINLYSFSKKLKSLGKIEMARKYYTISKYLIDKPDEIKPKFRSLLEQVMELPDSPEAYIEGN